jgi:hypothetical protein
VVAVAAEAKGPSFLGAAVGGVFINYRGDDSYASAALIDRELSNRFGSANVFFDSRSIPAGSDFAEELLARLRASSVLLVVIGPRWLTITDEAGRRRIDDPKDWIRREIVGALAQEIRVIPVLADQAKLPAEADLPVDIVQLGPAPICVTAPPLYVGRFALFGRPDHRSSAGVPAIFGTRGQSATVTGRGPARVACRWFGAGGAATTASAAASVAARLHRSCHAVGCAGSVAIR